MPLAKELLEKAESLGLNVDEDTTEDELQGLIDEKTKSLNSKKGSDDDDDDKDLEFYKTEAKKAFEARDKAKKERRKLADELEGLRKSLDSAPDPTEVKNLKDELAALKSFKKEIETEREEKELESKSELEKTKLRFDKQLLDLENRMKEVEEDRKRVMEEKEQAITEKEKEIEKLRLGTLEADIMKVAAKNNAYNPAQIFRLLKDEFIFDKNLGTFTKIVKDYKGKITDELSVEEAVSKFLEDPDNDNLVKSSVSRGMNSETLNKGKEASSSNKQEYKEFGYDPKDETLIRKADFARLSVEDYIDTLIMRDKKLKSIKEKGQG